jgi:hypothetical protein
MPESFFSLPCSSRNFTFLHGSRPRFTYPLPGLKLDLADPHRLLGLLQAETDANSRTIVQCSFMERILVSQKELPVLPFFAQAVADQLDGRHRSGRVADDRPEAGHQAQGGGEPPPARHRIPAVRE